MGEMMCPSSVGQRNPRQKASQDKHLKRYPKPSETLDWPPFTKASNFVKNIDFVFHRLASKQILRYQSEIQARKHKTKYPCN
jgi:hypothetical protein